MLDPIIEYPNSRYRDEPISGSAVVGGEVYRGDAVGGLDGTYVFGDLQADGALFAATRPDGDGLWPTARLPIAEADRDRLTRLFSFARDADGEVYALGVGARGGGVHRVVPAGE